MFKIKWGNKITKEVLEKIQENSVEETEEKSSNDRAYVGWRGRESHKFEYFLLKGPGLGVRLPQ